MATSIFAMDQSTTPAPVRLTESTEITATLREVDITSDLLIRPLRQRNHEREHLALGMLAREMAENPRNMLQKLVEIAVELCDAGSAGISILEGTVFRWEALAGIFGPYRGSMMPRDASPCGVCINLDQTQLMHLPDRHFPALRAEPRFVEGLLIPFHGHGKPVGTVWVVAHDFERKFDREDERIVRMLAGFASSGWQLWKASEAAQQSSRNKDEFVAMLGHELRNPLAAILFATDSLKNLKDMTPATMQEVEVIERQGKHLCRIVDDLIDLSRINRGKLELRKSPIDLKSTIDSAIELTRGQIEHRRHRLSLSLPDQSVYLDGDSIRLAQSFSNLLDNAAKYTPEGGEISVAAEVVDEEACIRIRDNGIGIPADRIEKVFDLFTQLNGPRNDLPTSGLGLGLSLVRTLINLHGGSVSAVSGGEGKGAEFVVRLPIMPKSVFEDRTNQISVAGVAPPSTRRILLVDDDDDVAESMGMVLALFGHEVSVASNGEMALKSLRTFDPEVVLLDLGLPGADGYEVARRMRMEAKRPNLVIVALSGYGQPEHRRRSKEAGCDDHLVKPIHPEVLRAFLDQISVQRLNNSVA